MVKNPNMTLAALPTVSTPRIATPTWQMQPAAIALPATRVSALTGTNATAAGYGTSGFGASAVVADKHSRQAKPAAPPRGPR